MPLASAKEPPRSAMMSNSGEYDMQPLTSGGPSDGLGDGVGSPESMRQRCLSRQSACARVVMSCAGSCKRPRPDICCFLLLFSVPHNRLREAVACICILAIAATAAALGVAVRRPCNPLVSIVTACCLQRISSARFGDDPTSSSTNAAKPLPIHQWKNST